MYFYIFDVTYKYIFDNLMSLYTYIHQIYIKTYQIGHFTYIQFIICQLYLN